MNSFVLLGIAIAAEVVATSCLKLSEGFTRLVPSVIVVLGYGIAFYFLSLALRTMPVGVAYGIWSGAGVALMAVIGWVAFGQKLDGWAMLGLTLIVSGVLVMNFLSKSAAH